jgi:hypothetical protein
LDTTPENKVPKVFICHATEDKERFVVRFAERLRKSGIDVWLDQWETLPGDKLVDRVFNGGLGSPDVVIIVLSQDSIHKPWVQKELDTAVVKSIEERTRLIPIRLDGGVIPAALKDTVYQDIRDLNSYDGDFERIGNAIFGQYSRPPLGQMPGFVAGGKSAVPGLAPIDSTIFECACRMALGQGHMHVRGEELVKKLATSGVSERQVMETEEVLEADGYIRSIRVFGMPHAYDFSITMYGFEEFAEQMVPDYATLCGGVRLILVRDVLQQQRQTSDRLIAEELHCQSLLVEHILDELRSVGLIKLLKEKGPFIHVYWVSPKLRRVLEENA